MKELIEDAIVMLQMRSECADLIYWCCKLGNEERLAIIFAYDLLYGKNDSVDFGSKSIEEKEFINEQERT